MANFEIEIKSLLGDREKAEELIEKMSLNDLDFKKLGQHKQLNHYFKEGNLQKLREKLSPLLPDEQKEILEKLIEQAKEYSIRTRQADDKVIFVMKISVDETSSSNGTARQEFESEVKVSLEELDKMLLDSNFSYLSKWSRERQEFIYMGCNVTVDKNAGYGYLAEFEKVLDNESQSEETKNELRKIMEDLGIEELDQGRLARMFDHYNKNWPDYYGTDKVFSID